MTGARSKTENVPRPPSQGVERAWDIVGSLNKIFAFIEEARIAPCVAGGQRNPICSRRGAEPGL
jgi:hypothetical protein